MSPRAIVFLLPGPGQIPVGGFRVAYEYAQGLAARGFDATVVHVAQVESEVSPRERARGLAGYVRRGLTGWRPDRWFTFRHPVRLVWRPSLSETTIPRADIYVATAWQTAEWLGRAKLPWASERLYLIQHDETWAGPEERVRATWKAPLRKIVIAPWLQALGKSLGENSTLIHNGLDLGRFGIDVPIDRRDGQRVAMLVHPASWKGTEIGLQALTLAQHERHDLVALLFGTGPAPEALPDWCVYHHDPTPEQLRALYNRASIILSPSFAEGWSLIGPEGMLCGAAFVATDIGGHTAYATHETNALLAPAGDAPGLARAIVRLSSDPELRRRLARAGNASMRSFTWDRAVSSLIDMLRTGGSDRA